MLANLIKHYNFLENIDEIVCICLTKILNVNSLFGLITLKSFYFQ